MIDVVVTSTGPLLTLIEAKQHLGVWSDDEDTLIETYADAAVQACLSYCDLKLVPVGAEPSFKAAALLNLGGLYAQREAIITGTIVALNPAVESLLRPWRIIRI